jgi:hypothetical protein
MEVPIIDPNHTLGLLDTLNDGRRRPGPLVALAWKPYSIQLWTKAHPEKFVGTNKTTDIRNTLW